ncbi:putative amidoligase enzyme-domain-containing protein [Tuber brumale]|nr:putative amidoligase enzyme-domain-containing protein [Tuber brumale]
MDRPPNWAPIQREPGVSGEAEDHKTEDAAGIGLSGGTVRPSYILPPPIHHRPTPRPRVEFRRPIALPLKPPPTPRLSFVKPVGFPPKPPPIRVHQPHILRQKGGQPSSPPPRSGGETDAQPAGPGPSLIPISTSQAGSPWPQPARKGFNWLAQGTSQLLTPHPSDAHRRLYPLADKAPSGSPSTISAGLFVPGYDDTILQIHNPGIASIASTPGPTSPPGFLHRNYVDQITVGVELEFVLLNAKSFRQAMELVTAECRHHELRIRDACLMRGGYEISTDESVSVETEQGVGVPLEVSTPILYNTSWKWVIPEMISILGRCGKLAFNTTTALHVHVGMRRKYRAHEIRRICKGIIIFEEEIDKLHHRTRVPTRDDRRSFYKTCRYNDTFKYMTTQQALSHLDSQPSMVQLVMCVNPDTCGSSCERTYKYNFCSLWHYRTIEFRQARATDDPGEILEWTNTVTKFVEACLNTRREEYVRMAGPSGITGDDLVRFGVRPPPIARPGGAGKVSKEGHKSLEDD